MWCGGLSVVWCVHLVSGKLHADEETEYDWQELEDDTLSSTQWPQRKHPQAARLETLVSSPAHKSGTHE